ncbi:11S globulin seed storage protein Jug r 4-like isoform X2 [Fagus crenata]
MAKANSFLYISLCLVVLFNGCLAKRWQQQQQFNQCQLDRLNALEPNNRIEAEAGVIESWDPNNQQFQCAGVAVVRHTLERNGLLLPQYSPTHQLIYIVQGRGYLGTVLPGCPETYQDSQQQQQQRHQQEQEQEQQQQQQEQGQSRRFRGDRHQKILHFRQGDIIAIPAGVAHWLYNNGDSQVVAVSLLDLNNQANQLDENPRFFYLAGNPDDEFQESGQGRRQQHQKGSDRRGNRKHGQRHEQQNNNNILSGFNSELLADILNVDVQTIRKLQGSEEERRSRKNIVKVDGELQVIRPPRSRQEQEREERQEREREREHRQSGRGRDNGLEETLCTLRLRENIGDASRADIYSPEAGLISTLNSNKLRLLNWLQLSAERGKLYGNAVHVAHWTQNAHTVIYGVNGTARVQVVDDSGRSVFDDELQQGQVLTVPQNFAVVKRASNEGFEWVAFKTNDNAKITPLAGQNSAIRAIPADVLANAYQISQEDAQELKDNSQDIALIRPSRSSSERRVM